MREVFLAVLHTRQTIVVILGWIGYVATVLFLPTLEANYLFILILALLIILTIQDMLQARQNTMQDMINTAVNKVLDDLLSEKES